MRRRYIRQSSQASMRTLIDKRRRSKINQQNTPPEPSSIAEPAETNSAIQTNVHHALTFPISTFQINLQTEFIDRPPNDAFEIELRTKPPDKATELELPTKPADDSTESPQPIFFPFVPQLAGANSRLIKPPSSCCRQSRLTKPPSSSCLLSPPTIAQSRLSRFTFLLAAFTPQFYPVLKYSTGAVLKNCLLMQLELLHWESAKITPSSRCV